MLSPQEAAESLKNARQTARRSGEAFGYRMASPHLFIWGAVWLAGYGASDLWPDRPTWIWLVVVALGAIAGFVAGQRNAPQSSSSGMGARFFGLFAIIAVFIAATFSVMAPVSGLQQGAFIPLLVAAIYAALGLWMGVRYIVLGAA